MGDSLSVSYGIDTKDGWVNLLRGRLAARGYTYTVVNASISGETSSGGLSRLPAALRRYRPAIMILELGANDGLQGLALAQLRHNLRRMIELGQQGGAKVLLIGMRLPPNYGPRYTASFQQVYQTLARRYHTALVPFMMQGFAADLHRFQPDGLHPNAAAQPAILDNVWPTLAPLLRH